MSIAGSAPLYTASLASTKETPALYSLSREQRGRRCTRPHSYAPTFVAKPSAAGAEKSAPTGRLARQGIAARIPFVAGSSPSSADEVTASQRVESSAASS